MRLLEILDVEFDNIRISEAVERSVRSMEEGGGQFVLLLDSQQLLRSRKSRMLMNVLSRALLVLPGDKGIYAAAKLLGMPLRYRMSTEDFAGALLARMSDMGMSVFILAPKAGVARRAADDLFYRFPGVKLAGAEDVNRLGNEDIVKAVNAASPDLLVLSMDYIDQMGFINALLPQMEVGLCLGIGRAMEKHTAKRGEEAFFSRLMKEPGRTFKEALIILAALRKRIFG